MTLNYDEFDYEVSRVEVEVYLRTLNEEVIYMSDTEIDELIEEHMEDIKAYFLEEARDSYEASKDIYAFNGISRLDF